MADTYLASVKGAIQGRFRGEQRPGDHTGKWVTVHGLEYSVQAPRDPSTGQATGKRQHIPVRLVVVYGNVSSQFMFALNHQELIEHADVDILSLDPVGRRYLSGRINLKHGHVTRLESFAGMSQHPHAPGGPDLQRVSLIFDHIHVDTEVGKRTFGDTWNTG